MINLLIDFPHTSDFLYFLLLTLILSCWMYRKLKNKKAYSLTPFILINILLFLTWGALTGICHDTSEHLHCAWMVSQGLIPYKDFWQHHPPLLWLVLSPIFKIIKPSFFIFEASRLLCGFIFAGIGFLGWKISKEVWGQKANRSVYLFLLFGSSILGQFLLLRPDLFMDIFLLLGVWFSLKAVGNKKYAVVFLAGVSFALTASFHLKQYALYFLPIIVIFLEKDRSRIIRFLLYILGFFVGLSPMLFYLIRNHILYDFIYWVFLFTSQKANLYAYFYVALVFVGGWGCISLMKLYLNSRNKKYLCLFIAFCLSTLSSITSLTFFYPFYIAFWYILCVIVGSGIDLNSALDKIPSLKKRSIIAGLFLSLFIFPNFLLTFRQEKTSFREHKEVILKLMSYCHSSDTCMVLVPLHPIFNYDASRLYSFWQYLVSNHFADIRNDITNRDIVKQIINARPAVIEYKFKAFPYDGDIFVLDLLLKKLALPQDVRKLRVFLSQNYTVTNIGKFQYYIRNDRLAEK